jgi:hypothetical protein
VALSLRRLIRVTIQIEPNMVAQIVLRPWEDGWLTARRETHPMASHRRQR